MSKLYNIFKVSKDIKPAVPGERLPEEAPKVKVPAAKGRLLKILVLCRHPYSVLSV